MYMYTIYNVIFSCWCLVYVGRGRAKNSRFYILASADKCVAEKEQTNVTIEPLMEAAMKQLQRLIELDSYTFQVQKQGCQRQMKRERELETYQQQSKVTVPNYSIYNLRYLIICGNSQIFFRLLNI